ncbi:MAG: lipopolysaccharide assembly protein LapA domain-containing protein [Phycisphaerales bacterium]
MGQRFRIIILTLLIVALLTLVLQNAHEVTVRLLVVRVTMPLALLLAIVLLGGFVCGLTGALIRVGGSKR